MSVTEPASSDAQSRFQGLVEPILFGVRSVMLPRHPRVLLAVCLGYFMAVLDSTVVNVALPDMARGLGTGVAGMQWVVDGYALLFASLLLTAGSLGDRLGNRGTFVWGLVLFTLASGLCGIAPSLGALVGFRALQGVGAAACGRSARSRRAGARDHGARGSHVRTDSGRRMGLGVAVGRRGARGRRHRGRAVLRGRAARQAADAAAGAVSRPHVRGGHRGGRDLELRLLRRAVSDEPVLPAGPASLAARNGPRVVAADGGDQRDEFRVGSDHRAPRATAADGAGSGGRGRGPVGAGAGRRARAAGGDRRADARHGHGRVTRDARHDARRDRPYPEGARRHRLSGAEREPAGGRRRGDRAAGGARRRPVHGWTPSGVAALGLTVSAGEWAESGICGAEGRGSALTVASAPRNRPVRITYIGGPTALLE